MIDHTPFWYIFIMACIVLLRAVAPLSIAYSAAVMLRPPSSYRLPSILEYWIFTEVLFYVVFYLYRMYYLQLPAVHPPVPSLEQRQALVQRCIDNIPNHERYISKWFLGAPLSDIKRENVKDFFRWAFLNSATEDPINDDELEGYVKKVEARMGIEFQPGRSNVKCLRLSIDDANILHRSLFWYLVSCDSSA
jgi:hypothetical protein